VLGSNAAVVAQEDLAIEGWSLQQIFVKSGFQPVRGRAAQSSWKKKEARVAALIPSAHPRTCRGPAWVCVARVGEQANVNRIDRHPWMIGRVLVGQRPAKSADVCACMSPCPGPAKVTKALDALIGDDSNTVARIRAEHKPQAGNFSWFRRLVYAC